MLQFVHHQLQREVDESPSTVGVLPHAKAVSNWRVRVCYSQQREVSGSAVCCEVLGRSGPSLQSGGHPCLVHAIFPCLSPLEGKLSNVLAAPPPHSQSAPVITSTASKCCKWLNTTRI